MSNSSLLKISSFPFKNRNYKVRLLQAFNHLMIVPAIIYGSPSLWIASIFFYFAFFCLGIDIGVHRLFSHGSFTTSRLTQWALGILMTLATVGSTLAWVGMHRQHHKFSDKPKDPHSPINSKRPIWGLISVYVGIWKSYVARPEFTSDLRRDPMHKFLHNYYVLIIIAYASILSLIDPLLMIFLYCMPAVFCFHGASLIVTAGHSLGSHDLETSDQSTNSIFVHLLTWGEGLHNLHHAYPQKYQYKFGLAQKWYFFDLPGFIITTFLKKN